MEVRVARFGLLGAVLTASLAFASAVTVAVLAGPKVADPADRAAVLPVAFTGKADIDHHVRSERLRAEERLRDKRLAIVNEVSIEGIERTFGQQAVLHQDVQEGREVEALLASKRNGIRLIGILKAVEARCIDEGVPLDPAGLDALKAMEEALSATIRDEASRPKILRTAAKNVDDMFLRCIRARHDFLCKSIRKDYDRRVEAIHRGG